ncbi:50S ribosomal protein L32e [Candidatus Woesearchaeota archaeon]|nr:50S ribosomal protein L32e [Candidatus Woesearchaeota archaeon]
MTQIKELLEIRERIKSKKPNFIRQDIRKKARLKIKWRKPRGLDSKIRRKLSGRANPVSQGYRSPKNVRGLHKSGLMQSMVRTTKDMDKLNPKENCLMISSSLGTKKRIEIIKKAREKKFEIVNIKSPEDYIKKVEEIISSRKKARKESDVKQKAKEVKKEEKETVSEDDNARTSSGTRTKFGIPQGDTHSVGKEAEKKEKDRLLTKKEI